jgi:hypothetical protein
MPVPCWGIENCTHTLRVSYTDPINTATFFKNLDRPQFSATKILHIDSEISWKMARTFMTLFSPMTRSLTFDSESICTQYILVYTRYIRLHPLHIP